MDRGSYAKRLTGQAARTLPVLKPTIPPFHRGIASEFMAARLEADSEPPVLKHAREQAPQPAQVSPTSPIASSEQATPKPVYRPKTEVQESRLLNPPSTRVGEPAGKVEIIGRREIERVVKPDVLKAPESPGNVQVNTSEAPKIDLGTPSFHPGPPRVKRSQPQEQKEIIESQAPVQTRASAERRAPAVSFSKAGDAKGVIEETNAATSRAKSSALPAIEPPSIELHRPSRKSQRSEKSAQELQPRKNPDVEKQILTAAMQFESRGTQSTAARRGREQESQARTSGGVHIGNLEIRIMPPAAPSAPVIKPQQARQAPATVLSRSFTSSLGLSQG